METSFIVQNFVPLMFAGLFVFLLSGIPVAFGLAATGLLAFDLAISGAWGGMTAAGALIFAEAALLTALHRRAIGLPGTALQGSGRIRNADRVPVDLGRLLCRRHHRLRLGSRFLQERTGAADLGPGGPGRGRDRPTSALRG